MNTMKRKLLSAMLCLTMMASILPFGALPVWAEDGGIVSNDNDPVSLTEGAFSYLDSEGRLQTAPEGITTIGPESTSWGNSESTDPQWYVVNSDVTINQRVTVTGDVHLILADGASLTVNGGINVDEGNSFTIYGQEQGTGTLNATGGGGQAGIGGGDGGSGGTITINGGTVTATGGSGGAGIGGGSCYDQYSSKGTITITGGKVTATGGIGSAGIGGGYTRGAGCNVIISGGVVIATGQAGYAYSPKGIGAGAYLNNDSGTFSTGENGNAMIIATTYRLDGTEITDGIGIEDKTGQANWSGVIFNGTTGQVYGTSVTPTEDFEIPEDYTLTIPEGASLTIPYGVTLTNNGTIINNGTFTNNGTIENYGSITGTEVENSGTVTNYFKYLDENGTEQTASATPIESTSTTWGANDDVEHWYVVNGNVTIDQRITVTGDVHLILADGASLTVASNSNEDNDMGISLTDGSSLTVYGQSGNTGKLTATGGQYGIATAYGSANSDISVYGGSVEGKSNETTGSSYGVYLYAGNIIVSGKGKLTGAAAESSTGTNSGVYLNDGTLTISGNGEVTGTGSSTSTNSSTGVSVWRGITVINNGKVSGTAGNSTGNSKYSYGVYSGTGNISISDNGEITGIGGNATGNGNDSAGVSASGGTSTITISGNGSVTGNGGTANDRSEGVYAAAGLTMSGGTLNATGGTAATSYGVRVVTSTITVSGGSVSASGTTSGFQGTFSTGESGNAVIFASSISDSNDTTGWNGVIFQGSTGQVYGTTVTLIEDFEIPGGYILTIPVGTTLDVSSVSSVTNSGTVICNGNISGTIGGDVRYPCTVTVAISGTGVEETQGSSYTAAYGSTITITATMTKQQANINAIAEVGKVNFYLGAVEGGTLLGTADVTSGSDGTYTATLTLKLEGTNWMPDETAKTISADFSGVAGDTTGSGLLANTGTATLTVAKASAERAPTVNQSDIEVTADSVTLPYNEAWEYRMENDITWKSGTDANVFTNLNHSTPYTFYVRVAETNTAEASNEAKVTVWTARETPTQKEGYSIKYEAETITVERGYEVNTAADFTGSNVSDGTSLESYIGQTLYIRRAAIPGEAPAGASATISIPNRPAAPAVQGVNETVAGRNDGKITGLTAGTAYEISSNDGTEWTDATLNGTEITGLASGNYQVRVKSTDTSFAGVAASVTISTGAAPTYTLSVSAPAFDSVTTGYTQPAAKALTITSSGNSDATISSVTVDNTNFVIGGSGSTVPAGGSISTWTIQPAAGLSAGTYTATVTVTYNDGQTAIATVTFTVTASPSTPSTPSRPNTPSKPEPSGPSTGENNGWQSIAEEIASASDGATITIAMNGETKVPGDIFEAAAGKNITVVFDMEDDVSWTLRGTDVPTNTSFDTIDLGVSMNTDGIPVDVINAVTGEATSVQITLSHDGDFGFALTLSAPLGEENAGYWANLYHYDEDAEAMDFETAAEIDDDGTARLRLTHASQYAIVIDDHPHETALPFTDVNANDWFYDPVVWAYGQGLMTGTSATTFEPNTSTTRAMIVAILNRLEDGPTASGGTFTDVHDGDWYAEAVNWAASVGIVAGFEDGSFRPNAAITREQMAAILYNYAQWKGMDVSNCADLSRYNDQPSPWANDVMQWAVGEGLISGTTATTLEPQGHATRAQVAAILERFLEN